MKIDSHQHFWHYHPDTHGWIDDEMAVLRRDYLPDELQGELKQAGYDGCVAVQAAQSEAETRFLLDLAAKHEFIRGVVGWLDLTVDNAEVPLAAFAEEKKLSGLRHIVQDEVDDNFLLQENFMGNIARLEKFGLTYDILIYPKHLAVAREFVAAFPNQKFVLDHLAKPFIRAGEMMPWAAEIKLLGKFPNVHCKFSGMITEADWQHWQPADFAPYLDTVLSAFGPERLMIGSDWPVCRLAGEYSAVMSVVEDYIRRLSVAEQAAILGENARDFYGLI